MASQRTVIERTAIDYCSPVVLRAGLPRETRSTFQCGLSVIFLCCCWSSCPGVAEAAHKWRRLAARSPRREAARQRGCTFQPVERWSARVGAPTPMGTTSSCSRAQPGAMVGTHTVRIFVSPEVVPNPPKIPAHYDTQSELRREVKAGEDNVFDFDLKFECGVVEVVPKNRVNTCTDGSPQREQGNDVWPLLALRALILVNSAITDRNVPPRPSNSVVATIIRRMSLVPLRTVFRRRDVDVSRGRAGVRSAFRLHVV